MPEINAGLDAEIDAEIGALSYEEARSRLVDVVSQLEQGSIPLEDSLRLWTIGEKLAAHCEAWLDGAQAQLDTMRAPSSPEGDQQ